MRSLLAIWLITLLSLTGGSSVHLPSRLAQDPGPITVEEYWELVESTHQSITEMAAKPPAEVRESLRALASRWDQVTAVELSDHSIQAVDPNHLTSMLREDPPELERLAGSLEALLNARESMKQEVFTLQDIEPLQEILARPEFQWGQEQALTLPEWMNNLFESILNFFDRLIFNLVKLIYEGRVVWMILAVVAFILSLFYISRNLSRSLAPDAQLDGDGGHDDAMLTSRGAMQRAQALSMQGDYRSAIRYLYLSSLLLLDEQGLLRYDRSRTNREYLRSVSSRPELANPLRAVIDVFDRTWYGFEDVDEETYKSYVQHVDELREKKE